MIGELIQRSSDWFSGIGYRSDIVTSSRVRIARNIEGYPFPHWCTENVLREIEDNVLNKITKSEAFRNSEIYNLDEIGENENQILMERNLVSAEFIKDRGKILLVSKDKPLSLILNEEDHIRMQTFSCGLELRKSWNLLDKMDDAFEEIFSCAYHKKFGYLTSCPTNTGTGIRASLMMHLPALVYRKKITQALKTASQVGLSVRGFHGEGTEALGNMYQISNQMSLGRSEDEIIDNIESIATYLVEREEKCREEILKISHNEVEDTVWRSYGILKNCRKITAKESFELLSNVRLGVSMGIITDIPLKKVNELYFQIQRAHVRRNMEKNTNSHLKRLTLRADIIRQQLS